MKKWILRAVLGVVVLAILLAGGVWFGADILAKAGIRHGGQYALGVPTNVEQVKLGLLDGKLMIDKLKVSNPKGYKTPHLLQSGRFDLQVAPRSVLAGPIDVQAFVLDGLDINLESTDTGNNISTILNNIKKLGGSSAEKPKAEDSGRKIRVGKLVIKNVVGHVHLALAGVTKDLTIKLPAVELDDVTKDSPDGVTVGGLVARILPAVLASIVKEGKGILPADLSDLLNRDIASTAGALGGQAGKLIEQVGGEAAARLQQQAGEAISKLQKNLGDGGKALDGLKSSIPVMSTEKKK